MVPSSQASRSRWGIDGYNVIAAPSIGLEVPFARISNLLSIRIGLLRPQFPRGRTVKLHYYPETDSLHIELKGVPGTREIVEGLNVDLDANGDMVGLDIDHASGKLDLSSVETIALPPVSAAVGIYRTQQ
jgi:uncharacterized protein YuzE